MSLVIEGAALARLDGVVNCAIETCRIVGTVVLVHGSRWFVDPARKLTAIALTNTSFEGMAGAFPIDLRDAVYG